MFASHLIFLSVVSTVAADILAASTPTEDLSAWTHEHVAECDASSLLAVPPVSPEAAHLGLSDQRAASISTETEDRHLSDTFICPRKRAPGLGERTVVHVLQSRLGSSRTRGTMISAVVDAQPGWWSTTTQFKKVDNDTVLRSMNKIDVCILVKHVEARSIQFCKAKGALIVLDVVDSHEAIPGLSKGHLIEGVDMYLPTSNHLSQLLSNTSSAVTLEHQHSNRGFARTTPSLPFACRVGVLGHPLNLGNNESKKELLHSICASNSVFSVVFVMQKETPGSRIIEQICPGAKDRVHEGKLMSTICAEQSKPWDVQPSSKAGCFKEQDEFHNDSHLVGVDLAVVWPPSVSRWTPGVSNSKAYLDYFRERPWNRLMFWLSHNVPTVFWPLYSYMQSAELGYRLPDGRAPMASTLAELTQVVSDVASSVKAKQQLCKQGLKIAKEFGTTQVGMKLVRILAARLN